MLNPDESIRAYKKYVEMMKSDYEKMNDSLKKQIIDIIVGIIKDNLGDNIHFREHFAKSIIITKILEDIDLLNSVFEHLPNLKN